jgi:hypothetical protein
MSEICKNCSGYGVIQSEQFGNVVCPECGGYGKINPQPDIIKIELPEHIYLTIIEAVSYAAGMAKMFDDPLERIRYLGALEELKRFYQTQK